MRETILMTVTLLALGCTQEDIGPDPDSVRGGDAPPALVTDGPRGDCDEVVCHDYGGGIQECTCVDDGEPVLDLGPSQQEPDPYAPR